MSEKNGIRNYFEDYIDVTSECERLPPDYENHLSESMPEWWHEVDQDEEYQKKQGEL